MRSFAKKNSLGDELGELLQVDVTTRNNGDDWALTCFASQGGRERQSSGAFGDDSRFFRHQAHCLLCFFQRDNDVTVYDWFHPLPHSRKNALAARAVNEGLFPVLEHLGRSFLE